MPRARVPVDLETVLVAALGEDDVLAALVTDAGDVRISTRLPSTFTAEARVKLNRSGGSVVGWPDHVDRALIDFHAYGETDTEAWSVVAELVRALADLEGTRVPGGVVTACDRTLGPLWVPDPDADDAPRYLVQYAVTAHPA